MSDAVSAHCGYLYNIQHAIISIAYVTWADLACRADRFPEFENSKNGMELPRIDYVCTELMLGQFTTK